MTDDVRLWVREELQKALERITRLEERHDGALIALALQAAEYERRLDQLNGAHAQQRAERTDFVLNSLHDVYKERTDSRLIELASGLADLRGATEGKAITSVLMFKLITAIISILAIGATIYFAIK